MSPLLVAALILGAPPADTLPVPHRYLDAIEAGTRSVRGAPGAAYWQQKVDYRLSAELLPDQLMVTGSETIRYENRSPDTLTEIWLNLPQNVFAPGNPRNRPAPITGGFTLDEVRVQGVERQVRGRGGSSLPTVAALELPEALPPGGVAELEIAWHFTVPEGTFRMGRDGSEVFFLAQWYPQVAVYDDLRGWVRDPYMGDGEFYLEYGDFDAALTAPEGWLVSASGVLENADEVLTSEGAARLSAISRDRITPVVSLADRDQGRATATGGGEGTLTWRFRAENVRDFAWGASDRYVWDATVAEVEQDDGSVMATAIHSLYRPERENWDRSAEYARHAIEAHSYWYPYPYPQMTVNEGVIGGGMEYPMITIIGGNRTPLSLYGVISHELAHMWWPMVIGTDERRHAWMDEGLASFSEDLFTPSLFPDAPGAVGSMRGYLRIAGTDGETESMRAADLYGPSGNRGTASYGKPATVFRALRAILGEDTFDLAMRTYMRRWAFRHPDPVDLFNSFEDVTGEDLDWFFQPWMYTTGVMNQAVVDVVTENGGTTVILLEDRGEITMPVHLELMLADGNVVKVRTDRDVWEDGRAEIRVTTGDRVTLVVLDPDQQFPDVDRDDNRWVGPMR